MAFPYYPYTLERGVGRMGRSRSRSRSPRSHRGHRSKHHKRRRSPSPTTPDARRSTTRDGRLGIVSRSGSKDKIRRRRSSISSSSDSDAGKNVNKRIEEARRRIEERKWLDMERQRLARQKEMDEKLIEEEVARRVEQLVAKRVVEELEKRKEEIEAEVQRRIEEAKRIMEKQLMEEMERQRQAEMEAQRKKEVKWDADWILQLDSERDARLPVRVIFAYVRRLTFPSAIRTDVYITDVRRLGLESCF